MKKYVPFKMHYGNAFYKHFEKSLHVRSSNPTYVQNFRPVPLTVFEILAKKNDNKKRNGHISHVNSPFR